MDKLENELEDEIGETAKLELREKLAASTTEKLIASIGELTEDLYTAYLEGKWQQREGEKNINCVAETAQIVENIGDNPVLLGEVVSALTEKQAQLVSELKRRKGELAK